MSNGGALEDLRDAIAEHMPDGPGCGTAMPVPVRYTFMGWSEEKTEEVVRAVWEALPNPTGAHPGNGHRDWFRFCDRVGYGPPFVSRAIKHLRKIGALKSVAHGVYEKTQLPEDPLFYWRWKVVQHPCPDSEVADT